MKDKNKLKRSGADSLESWVACFWCSLVGLVLFGMVRLSGMLFVASMEEFNVGREQASFPYVLCDVTQALISPVTGYFATKFGTRPALVFGSLVAAIGIGANFFASDIGVVTVLWGVVFGIGFGFCCPVLPIVITQHFVQKRATAIGIMYVGSYLGICVLPTILEFLISTYGLKGTFLWLSALTLHCVPASMLLKKPKLDDTVKSNAPSNQHLIVNGCGEKFKKRTVSVDAVSGGKRVSGKSEEMLPDPLCLKHILEEKCTDNNSTNFLSESVHRTQTDASAVNQKAAQNGVLSASKTDLSWIDQNGVQNNVSVNHIDSCSTNNQKGIQNNVSVNHIDSCSTNNQNGVQNNVSVNHIDSCSTNNQNGVQNGHLVLSPVFYGDIFPITSCGKLKNKVNPSSGKLIFQQYQQSHESATDPKPQFSTTTAFKVFLEPIFILVLLSTAVYACSFIAFMTIIVDFAQDVGLPFSDGKYIILGFSIASNVGLISFGWVTDGGFMSLTNFSGVVFFLRSFTLVLMPFCGGFTTLMCVVMFQGLSEASIANLLPLIIADYYAEDVHRVAISSSFLLSGPVHLSTPYLISFFRDGLGSYDYLFYAMGGTSFLCSVLFFTAPLLAKCRCGRSDNILRNRTATA